MTFAIGDAIAARPGRAGEAQAKAEQERATLRAIEAPYLEVAAAEVPEVLRVPTPAGLTS